MRIFAALPVMNEPDVEKTIRQILTQTQSATGLYICVNQPESYKNDPEKHYIFEQNQKTIAEIRNYFSNTDCHESRNFSTPTETPNLAHPYIYIIDKSTVGWDSKNHGVGWARKILMDAVNDVANPDDIIISLDADTEYPPAYFESVKKQFAATKNLAALSNPYYHKLIGQDAEDRAILRYEIYMRCYHLNLDRIRSPYAFTALGSAMAVRVDAYRKMGGMAPKKSGEDFYFLQQLCKIGAVSTHNPVVVYPAARLSSRVFFGTGPALIKGINGDWNSYPIYSPKLWDKVAQIYQHFDHYFSPEDYQKLKANSKTDAQFQKFCHEKFDGLRILQYLKSHHTENLQLDEAGLKENLDVFDIKIPLPSDFAFKTAEIALLDKIRDALAAKFDLFKKY